MSKIKLKFKFRQHSILSSSVGKMFCVVSIYSGSWKISPFFPFMFRDPFKWMNLVSKRCFTKHQQTWMCQKIKCCKEEKMSSADRRKFNLICLSITSNKLSGSLDRNRISLSKLESIQVHTFALSSSTHLQLPRYASAHLEFKIKQIMTKNSF